MPKKIIKEEQSLSIIQDIDSIDKLNEEIEKIGDNTYTKNLKELLSIKHENASDSNKEEVNELIFRMRLDGMSKTSICNKLIDLVPDLKLSYAKRIVDMCEISFQEKNQEIYEKHIAFEIERFETLMEKSVSKGNLSEARLNLIEINKLKGLYIKKVETTTTNNYSTKWGTIIDITSEEVKKDENNE
jgi:hypothetical protein